MVYFSERPNMEVYIVPNDPRLLNVWYLWVRLYPSVVMYSNKVSMMKLTGRPLIARISVPLLKTVSFRLRFAATAIKSSSLGWYDLFCSVVAGHIFILKGNTRSLAVSVNRATLREERMAV